MSGILFLLALATGVCSYSNPVVDISHWNDVNFQKVKNDGIVAVIHKATQGVAYVDPTYHRRKIQAKNVSLLWGAYHFGIGGKSGADQAKHFLRTVDSTTGILLALDVEPNKQGRTMTVAEADEFVRTVHQMVGRYPLLYGSPFFLDSYNTPALKSCPLWLSHYTSKDSPRLPAGWSSWTLWQYTDGKSGGDPKTVNGIGEVDRDRYNGTVAELKSRWPTL